MKVKAVIWKKDRTNAVIVLRKKKLEAGKIFRHGDHIYQIDSDRVMITYKKILFLFKYHYLTFYYTEGVSKPLPAPDFQDLKDGETLRIIDNGVGGEELAAIFNPWFYRTIAPTVKPLYEKLLLIAAIVGAGAGIYAAYQVSQLPSAEELAAMLQAAQNATNGPVVVS